MLQSIMHLRSVKPGFDPSNVTAFDMSLPFTAYNTREQALTFHRELQRQLMAVPGVVSVGTISNMPLVSFGIGCSVVLRQNRPYLVGGRIPSWRDIDDRSQVIVVTQALARRQ